MRIIAIAIAALGVATSAMAQTAPPPVEAFGSLPAISDAAISPDGTKVAIASSHGEESLINVIDLTQHRVIYSVLAPDNASLDSVDWADDAHVSFVIRQTFGPHDVLPHFLRFRGGVDHLDYYRNGVLDFAAREFHLMTTGDLYSGYVDAGAAFYSPIEGDPGFGRLVGYRATDGAAQIGLFRVNLATGTAFAAPALGVNRDTNDIMIDERGEVVARVDIAEGINRWRLFVYENHHSRLLMEDVSDTGEPIDFVGLLADGRLAALDTGEKRDRAALFAIDRATGAREVLFERANFEIRRSIRDPWTRRVVGVAWTETEVKQHFFDAALNEAYEKTTTAFEGASARILSWSRDRSRFVVYAEYGLDGGGYYVFSPADGRIERVSMRYPELATAELGERQSISYPARDGVRVPAYLTFPNVADRRNLPMVVLVHGGPHGVRDTMDFDFFSAFLASRGYLVLQPNYRGSGGYGAAWELAGRRQWGALMQTDVEDGVASLVRAGIADASRICIVGASYGGYAALAGATLTPDRYKCAASIAGLSDLNEFLRVRAEQMGAASSTSDFWRLSIGDRQEDRERINGVSPANLADRVHIPILLIHGTDDTVVPIDQSRRMRDRLQAAHKDVRYVELAGDDHYLSQAPTRILTLRELETFLAANLGSAEH